MESDIVENEGKRENPASPEKTEKSCPEPITFYILIRGRNCARYIEKCIRTIRRQDYSNWKAVISLDKPTDNSEVITRRLIEGDNRFYLSINNHHLGVCGNMFKVIRVCGKTFFPDDEDIVVVVDADDWITKDALFKHYEKYRKYNALITHGSYMKLSKSKKTKISRPYPKSGNVRRLAWRGSHLKTIKWKVVKHAKAEWFQHNGKWLEAASDLALMFNCIEIAGINNVFHVKEVVYYWNDHVTKKKEKIQGKCAKILRRLK